MIKINEKFNLTKSKYELFLKTAKQTFKEIYVMAFNKIDISVIVLSFRILSDVSPCNSIEECNIIKLSSKSNYNILNLVNLIHEIVINLIHCIYSKI